MEERFQLPVQNNGDEYLLNSSLIVIGFTHKFIVEIEGIEITFEPDEECNYRAIIPYGDLNKSKFLDPDMLKKISQLLSNLTDRE